MAYNRVPYSYPNSDWDYQVSLRYHAEVYRWFKLEKYLENHKMKVSHVDYYKGHIRATNEDRKNVNSLIREFEDGIHNNKVKLTHLQKFSWKDIPGLSELIFNERGDPRSEIRSFLESKAKAKKPGNFYIDIQKDGNVGPCCTVYANTKSACQDLTSVVERAFDRHEIDRRHLKKMSAFIEKQKQKGRLIVDSSTSSASTAYIYCICDISNSVVTCLSKTPSETIPLANHYATFLEKYGEKLLYNVGQKTNVKTTVDTDQKQLVVEGDFDDMENFKKHLMALIYKECFTLTRPRNSRISEHFDDIADRHRCTWSCCVVDQHNGGVIEGCDYLTTFYHPAHPGSLSCVIGNVTQLTVDALILLVTDTMSPLHKFEDVNSDVAKIVSNDHDRKPYCGEVVVRKTLHRQSGWLIQLVREYTNKTSTYFAIRSWDISKVLRSVEDNKCKTVCVPVTHMLGRDTCEDIVKTLVGTYITEKWEEKDIQLLLCFEEGFSDTDKICAIVEERFQKAWKKYFRRRENKTEGGTGLSEDVKITLRAESQRLQDIQVDAIVNPTRLDLDLSKGFVSQCLSYEAGEQLQRECNRKKPFTFDSVMVTSPYKLKDRNKGLKHIIHGALPAFEVTNFQKNVKKLVKLCLIKAEEEKCQSIAFPALGTGNHGNPKRETIRAMFDAVHEYANESFTCKLKTVVFALTDDDSTRAFENEEKRRGGSFKSYLPADSDTETLEGSVTKGKNSVTIIFGEQLENLPSYVVDVDFVFMQDQSWRFKFAIEEPSSSHDKLSINLDLTNDDTDCVRKAIQSCLACCKQSRITEIKLGKIDARTLTTTEYYGVVTNTVLDFVKYLKSDSFLSSPGVDHGYIHRIYIELCRKELVDVKKCFLKPVSTLSGMTSLFGSTNFTWQLREKTRQPVQIQILGMSKESVLRAKSEMSDVTTDGTPAQPPSSAIRVQGPPTSDFGEDSGAIPKQYRKNKDEVNDKPVSKKFKSEAVMEDQQIGEYDKESFINFDSLKISTEINSGYIAFKTKFNDLDRWIDVIETSFSIKIEQSGRSYRVLGTYNQIIHFKDYLDDYFPRDPDLTKLGENEVHISGRNNHPETNSHERDEFSGRHTQQQDTDDEDFNTGRSSEHSNNGSYASDAHQDIFIEMEEMVAGALMKLHKKSEITGLLDWRYSINSKALVVKSFTSNEKKGTTEIQSLANLLCKQECKFIGESFMVAESKTFDLNEDPKHDAYFGVNPIDQRIVIFARTMSDLKAAEEKLKSLTMDHGITESSSPIKPEKSSAFWLRENKVQVLIYNGDLKSLDVECVAIPASKSPKKIQGLQEIMLKSAGQQVKDEYQSLFKTRTVFKSGEYKRTSAGNLKYKCLYYVYVPQLKGSRETNIEDNALLEEVLLTCLKAADEEKCLSIGFPFIGAGKTGYQLDICAQQYFRAVTNKTWTPKHLQEIHFVSNDGNQVSKVRDIFGHIMHMCRVGNKDPSEDKMAMDVVKEMPIGRSGRTKLYVAEGCVSAVQVDAIACHQNTYFTSNHGLCGNIYQLCNKKTQDRLDGERSFPHKETVVYPVKVAAEDELTCQYILYISIPYSKDGNKTDQLAIGKLERLTETSTFNILATTSEMRHKSIALPLLGKEGKDTESITQIRCKAMMKGIFRHTYKSETTVEQIHVLDEDLEIVSQLRHAMMEIAKDFGCELSGRGQSIRF